MQVLPSLRRQRLWLAFLSLAFSLPWLALVGSGRCALQGDASAVAERCCAHCCPPTAGVRSPVSDTRPAESVFCCETFKYCLPSDASDAEHAGQAARATVLDVPSSGGLSAFVFGALCPRVDLTDSGLILSVPPSAFLRTVTRRCFPSHAPPFPAALA